MAAPTAAPLRQTLLRNPSSDSSFTSLSSATSDYTASTSSSSQLGTSYTSNASSTHKGGILRPAQAPSPGPPAAGDAGRPAPGGATPDEAGAPSSSVPSSSRPCSSISFAPLPPIPIRRRASIAVGVAARGQLLRSQAGCGGGSSKQRSQGIQYVAMTDEEWEAYKRQFSRAQVANPKDDDLPDLGTLALKGARKLGSMVSAARARRASASSNASSQSSATTSSTSSSLPSSVGACAVLVRPPMEEEEEEEEGISPPPSRPRSPPPPTAMDEDEDEDEGQQSADMDSEFGGSSVVEEDEDEIGVPPSPPSVFGAPVEKRWHDLEGIGGAAGGVGTGSGEVTPRRRGSFSGTTDFPVHGHDAFVLGFNQKLALEGGSDGGAWPPPRAVSEQ